MKKITAEDFVAFLEREGAREKFIANVTNGKVGGFPEMVKKDGSFDMETHVEETLSYGSRGTLSCAFRWADTPEGHTYWRNLRTKWVEECEDEAE